MIKKIVLRNFRNYSGIELSLESPVNVFTGRNGQGKTNLLEAVYFLSMLRSFRSSRVNDLKKIGSNGFYIASEISERDWSKKLEAEYGISRKLKIDGNAVSRASDFIRQIKAIVFSPEDINIVTGNSGLRRRFIDMLISVQIPGYLSALNEYMTALRSRNILLKSGKFDINMLKAYEFILADKGNFIVNYRKKYVRILVDEIKEILKGFYSDPDFDIKYRFQSGTDKSESYLERFDRERDRDIQKRITNSGPQLDEFDIILNSKLLRNFGSTGQCRLISLCLKMAKVNVISKENDSDSNNIVALVDDVTGELDSKVKESFFKVINKAGQIFFTFTEKPVESFFKDAKTYKVENESVNCL
jgi:DNA replication and repair protein RecF